MEWYWWVTIVLALLFLGLCLSWALCGNIEVLNEDSDLKYCHVCEVRFRLPEEDKFLYRNLDLEYHLLGNGVNCSELWECPECIKDRIDGELIEELKKDGNDDGIITKEKILDMHRQIKEHLESGRV